MVKDQFLKPMVVKEPHGETLTLSTILFSAPVLFLLFLLFSTNFFFFFGGWVMENSEVNKITIGKLKFYFLKQSLFNSSKYYIVIQSSTLLK